MPVIFCGEGIHPTAKVSEEVNRKCPLRNTTVQLSIHYADPDRQTDNSIVPIADHTAYSTIGFLSEYSWIFKKNYQKRFRMIATLTLLWTLAQPLHHFIELIYCPVLAKCVMIFRLYYDVQAWCVLQRLRLHNHLLKTATKNIISLAASPLHRFSFLTTNLVGEVPSP